MGMFHNKNSVFVFVCPQTRLQSGLVFSDWTLYSSVTFDLADCDSVYVWSQNHTLLFELSKFVLDSSQGLLFSFSNITWMARRDHQRRISRKWIPKLGSFRDEGREENDWRLPRWSVDSIVLCWHFLRTTLGDKQSPASWERSRRKDFQERQTSVGAKWWSEASVNTLKL